MADDIVPEILKNIQDHLAAIEVRLGNVETALADLHGQFSFITSRQPSVEALARLVAEQDKRITALECSDRFAGSLINFSTGAEQLP